jgi:anti-sigma factor RsiW
LLGAYVLCSVDPDEARAVREHLAVCELCAEEHAAFIELVLLLRQYEIGPDEET